MSKQDRQHDDQMRGDRQRDSQWDICPPGELTQMVHRLDASQHRAKMRQVYKTALMSTAVFACFVLALGSMMGPGDPQYGGIRCSFCSDRMAEYHPHAAGELVHQDAAFVASMETHLEKCALCRGKFNAMYPDSPILSAAATGATVVPISAIARQPIFAVGRLSIQRSW